MDQLNINENLKSAIELYHRQHFSRKLTIILGGIVFLILIILLICYRETILNFFVKLSHIIKESKYGELIIWIGIIVVSFPPLIGLSTLCELAGMAYGVSLKTWIIVSTSTVVGSAVSFVVFRYILQKKSQQLLKKSRFFAAVANVLSKDKDKFLLMFLLQLLPRPYSITNAAFASVPGISLLHFVITSFLVSPKYLQMAYVGHTIVHIGENKDARTRMWDIISLVSVSLIAMGTTYFIYLKTKKRLEEFQQDEEDDVIMSLGDERFQLDQY